MSREWKDRSLSSRLPGAEERTLVVLTGARQVGKTSLATRRYPGLRYVSMDAVEDRKLVRELRTSAWSKTIGTAVVDEAQKEPAVFDKVKLAFDSGEIDFSVILGSAQIALLRRVSDTLAGRALVFELWPLMAAELAGSPGLLPALRSTDAGISGLLENEPEMLLAADEEPRIAAVEHLSEWGGMPGLLPLGDERRRDWLRSYSTTYLERDLADLARLDDLLPFHKFQQLAALRAAQIVNFAELGRDAGIAAKTARNYLEYLRISYQAFLLQPYFENLTSSAVKSPKLFWTDVGLVRQVSGVQGPMTGALFENLVVAEIIKDLRTSGASAKAFYYATRSGMEVDVLLQTGDKLLGMEIKNRDTVARSDASAMRRIARAIGDRWRGGLVVYRGRELTRIDDDAAIWAMPVHRLV